MAVMLGVIKLTVKSMIIVIVDGATHRPVVNDLLVIKAFRCHVSPCAIIIVLGAVLVVVFEPSHAKVTDLGNTCDTTSVRTTCFSASQK